MGQVINGDVIRVAAKQFGPDEQQVVNVFFWKYDGLVVIDDSVVMSLLAAHVDSMYKALESFIPIGQQADEIDFYNITQTRPMGAQGYVDYVGGTGTGEYLPSGVAALLSASTAVKKVLPKKYFGLLLENHQTNDEWVAALMTALGVVAGIWWQSVSTPGGGLLRSGTWRRVAQTFVELVSITVKSLCSYQRRRKPGRGR